MQVSNFIHDPALDILIQPFPIHFACHNYHIIFFLKDHPEYESIEAMISLKKQTQDIRAIITRHDKSQIDHVNNNTRYEEFKNKKVNREVIYTPIIFNESMRGGKKNLNLLFKSYQNEAIELNFYCASTPSDKHSGLINPRDHSLHSSLPIMYPERTTLAGNRSRVIINGLHYKAPIKLWIPLLFKGLDAYYSENFAIAVFREESGELTLINHPNDLCPGEKWIYKYKGSEKVYEIKETVNDVVFISNDNSMIKTRITENILNIEEITFFSNTYNDYSGTFSLRFDPVLPLIGSSLTSQYMKSNFFIDINHHSSEMTGRIIVSNNKDSADIYLMPSHPDWAITRPLHINIRLNERSYIINSVIAEKEEI